MIDKASVIYLKQVVKGADSGGAKVLLAGKRRGALMEPTVINGMPWSVALVRRESFGSLAPITKVKGLDDAATLTNSTDYGLFSGVVTANLSVMPSEPSNISESGSSTLTKCQLAASKESFFGGIKGSV
ncbi:MAG: NADP-dependent glyceraldehyde-3-phosphate dehydrogenase [Verrucomicrobia subdivision 3 bacterium]|nr:NADP-dependent glyceraldehyde-3-phosphate dehydrogenase [Limisphaerales bacterium]MCS1417592.1 NADP-dependent glyceraldehyde-3-phosphate dehydrogenase [Limisphaerales bacterium]